MGTELRAVTRLLRAAAAAALTLWFTPPAHAHNNRAALAFYGGFGPAASRCQRVISKAAESCAIAVVAARAACVSAQVDGLACDSPTVDATTLAARQQARDLVQQACTDEDAKALQFNGLEEAQTDAATACGEAETAAVSATYGPVMLGGSVGSVDDATRACLAAAVQNGERVMRLALRVHRHRSAARPLGSLRHADVYLLRSL